MGSGAQTWTGAVMGTGSDLDIDKIGFHPRAVLVVNASDPGYGYWTDSMADDSMAKQIDGTSGFVTSNGITPRDNGFTLGADTDLNVSGELIHVTCWR